MADTKGLIATRADYLAAVENGETDLDHKAWYEQMVQKQSSANAEAAKSIKAGYDRVAAKKG
ncbi:MAG: hypothetical protein WC208_13500 [Gallionella sp.]|jgi:hypothetical protein